MLQRIVYHLDTLAKTNIVDMDEAVIKDRIVLFSLTRTGMDDLSLLAENPQLRFPS